MPRQFKRREDEEELIRKFEALVKKKSTDYFDLDAFETIIDYYLTRNKNKKAMQAIEMAMELHPFSGELIAAQAQVLSNLEKFEEAEKLLKDYRESNPYDTDAMLNLGSVYSMQKKFDQAIALYTDALESNEEILDEIHYNLGLAYQGMENFPVAIDRNRAHSPRSACESR